MKKENTACQEEKEILRKQLALLAECSQKGSYSYLELAEITKQMVAIYLALSIVNVKP